MSRLALRGFVEEFLNEFFPQKLTTGGEIYTPSINYLTTGPKTVIVVSMKTEPTVGGVYSLNTVPAGGVYSTNTEPTAGGVSSTYTGPRNEEGGSANSPELPISPALHNRIIDGIFVETIVK